MQSLLHKVGSKEGIASDGMQTQTSSAKLVDTSVLTSTTAVVKTVPPKLVHPPMLNVCKCCGYLVTFCIACLQRRHQILNSKLDVAADVTMNKKANHANVTTESVTVVEEIVHEDGNKTLESGVIANMAEDTVDETVGHSGVENDDGYVAGEEIVATTNENVVE